MPALLERPKMTRTMYEALKRHIMNERAKIKQEQEQDALIERMRKEKEQQKKKEEEEALTLEQTREQIAQLEKKLEELRSDKHQLFLQLKKVLNQEEETRRRAQLKEQSEMLSLQQQSYPQHIGPSGHTVMLQPSHMSSRPTLYKPVQGALKRTRSPSPPPSSSYQGSYHSDSKYSYSAAKAPPSHLYAQHNPPSDFKMGSYPMSQGGQTVYASQSTAHYVQQGQQPAVTAFQGGQSSSGKYSSSQSAFSNYTGHYSSHQTGKSEAFSASYGLQRMPQPGYHSQQPSATLQHQLEQAQKSAFSEDKYKQASVRTISTSQQGPLMSQALMQPQPSKGSIVTGIPAQVSSNFLPSAQTSTYQNQAGSTGRPSYSTQSHHQYYQGH